ncbi:hypothetical protein shim_21010 [Shimia sp. SK013]|uniref:hypothetical protein n=1 Tax=Shimia sp. SK013 TaxID=1389006 RepID=UPI0006CD8000|nr:hypothetical protein [Shimia sp. SK013]KPA21397.1 hypothetical protein shim_21010 [Shimia sp. SK013]
MRHRHIFLAGVVAFAIPAAALAEAKPSDINPLCPNNASAPLPPNADRPVDPQTDPAAFDFHNSPYPDFGFMVSQQEYFYCWSDQPIFRLKTDFPNTLPDTVPDFVGTGEFMDPSTAAEYLEKVKRYSLTGNTPNWNPFENTEANWYHIPWLHSSPTAYPPNGGTEGFRGLIKEAPMSPHQISAGQDGQDGNYSVYAITLVNDIAAYTLHEMWKNPEGPDPRVTDARYGGGFKDGAVFAKLLFTDAPRGSDKGNIPFLENPYSWFGYITPTFDPVGDGPVTREVHQVNLLQMDIMVRDSTAPVTNWVLGTFAYNGQADVKGAPAPADRSDAEKLHHNLIPVGLMWGNDPQDTTNTTTPFPPTKTMINPDLKETIITDSANLPAQHLGWNGRLNGPADLNTTSCLACHIMAQYPALTSLVPPGSVPDGGPNPPDIKDMDEWMFWFQNIPAATSSNASAYSTDFSFQVAISLTNFYAAKDAAEFGHRADEYLIAPVPIGRGVSD